MSHDDSVGDEQPYAAEILEHQIRQIESNHPDIAITGIDGATPREAGQPFGFLYRKNKLLVRSDAVAAVLSFLEKQNLGAETLPTAPLLSDHPKAGRDDVQASDRDKDDAMSGQLPVVLSVTGCVPGRDVPDISRLVQANFAPDHDGFPAATPHHVFYMTPKGPLCPATEPDEVGRTEPVYPAMRAVDAGAGSAVAVLDTGFVRSAAGHFRWLSGVSHWDPDRLDKFDIDHLTDSPDGFIDPYAGHGTFIAGVIGRIAPAADIHVRRLDIDLRAIFTSWPSYSADIVDELHLPDHIRMALWSGRKVISVSAGGPTLDDNPPLSFRGIRTLLDRDEAVLIAAAGNESSTQPFWPARFDWVTGVGALDATKTAVASYSNYGANADVYSPGTDIVNAYACGQYQCFQPPDTGTVRHFHGLAKWSGTSFATPVVAGLVAARMAKQGETAPAALAALLKIADTAHVMPGVGPTLMPEYTDLGI